MIKLFNPIILKIMIALLFTFLFSACSQEAANTVEPKIKQINTDELAVILNNADALHNKIFIDVREEDEYQSGHIQEMKNIPLSMLAARLNEIPKEKEVIVICRSGNRSMSAAQILQEHNYSNITNVQGGMNEWKGALMKK